MSGEASFQFGYNGTEADATKAWKQKFAVPHVKVKRGLPDPFDVGRRLGGGGVGEVFETKLGGVPLALKRVYTRYLTEAVYAEVNIMRQMAKNRHHHIVELIGSYEKRHNNSFEIGLLIWPVAICDLAALLQDVNTVHWHVYGGEKEKNEEEDIVYAIETLARLELEPKTSTSENIKNSRYDCLELLSSTLRRLQSSVGCIASAVEWLHNCHIRHKDLKPSQILLSASGVWLSDFGWSKDVSELTCSATDGGKTTTPKYLAPERALNQPCGRPEDIFSLGCIFLELGYQVFRGEHDENEEAPWFQKGWLFSNNIEDVISFVEASAILSPQAGLLGRLIMSMLRRDPALRPTITEVVKLLAEMPVVSGLCCQPTISTNLDFNRAISTNDAEHRALQSTNHQKGLVPQLKRQSNKTYAHASDMQRTPRLQYLEIQDPERAGYDRIHDDLTTENATTSKAKPLRPLPTGRHSRDDDTDDELDVLSPTNHTHLLPAIRPQLTYSQPLGSRRSSRSYREASFSKVRKSERAGGDEPAQLTYSQPLGSTPASPGIAHIHQEISTSRKTHIPLTEANVAKAQELLVSPQHHRSRSMSKERITQRVMEKLARHQQQQAEASSSKVRKSEGTGRDEPASPHHHRSRSMSKERITQRVIEKLARHQQQQAEASSSKVRKSEGTGRDEPASPHHHRSRSMSKERITQRVIEKLAQHQQQQAKASSSKVRKSKGTGRDEPALPHRSSRRHRMASRGEVVDLVNETESDSISVRTGLSTKSSINNPKLPATIEDILRRLFPPELNSLEEKHALELKASNEERALRFEESRNK